MTLTLARTKLNRPRISRDIIQRPALVQRLNDGLDRSLSLIVAPAGFGKTMLVAEWVSQAPQRVAWLSLDEGDNDVAILVGYLIATIRQLFPGACPDTEALIHAALVPPPETLVPVLSNEIDDLPDRFVLVLDDYHCITEPALHQLFDQLLQHLPLQLHLLLTSRSDPPLALHRLRANRALNELRSADLRFSVQETAAFLAQTVGVKRGARLADVLMKHMEGWVAGLQLAALSLRAAPDALADESPPGTQSSYYRLFFRTGLAAPDATRSSDPDEDLHPRSAVFRVGAGRSRLKTLTNLRPSIWQRWSAPDFFSTLWTKPVNGLGATLCFEKCSSTCCTRRARLTRLRRCISVRAGGFTRMA